MQDSVEDLNHQAMDALGKEPAKFYKIYIINPKIHKQCDKHTVPPPRPIISGSDSDSVAQTNSPRFSHLPPKTLY